MLFPERKVLCPLSSRCSGRRCSTRVAQALPGEHHDGSRTELSPATDDLRSLPLTGRFCSWLSGHFSARQSCKNRQRCIFFFGCPTAISTPCMSGSCHWTRSTRNFSQVSHTLSESSVRCTIGQENWAGRLRKYMTK